MQYLPLDIATSFWAKISRLANDAKIGSILKVQKEIERYDGAVKQWVNNELPFDFFCESDSCINEYALLMQWAHHHSSHYLPQALSDFADINKADAWLIAQAQYEKAVLVTYEVADPLRKKSIKIPDVCLAFGVECINMNGMFRKLKETF